MLTRNLDFRTIYMLHGFLTSLDEETRRKFHPPVIYPLYRNPYSLISYMRFFLSVIIPRRVLLKTLTRLACITITAKSNHTIQGFAYMTVRRSLTKCYESQLNMVVSKKFRKKGIGGTLLETSIYEATKTGVIRITLNVLKENAPALNLYRRHGFKIVKETMDSFYSKTRAVLDMELSLTLLNSAREKTLVQEKKV